MSGSKLENQMNLTLRYILTRWRNDPLAPKVKIGFISNKEGLGLAGMEWKAKNGITNIVADRLEILAPLPVLMWDETYTIGTFFNEIGLDGKPRYISLGFGEIKSKIGLEMQITEEDRLFLVTVYEIPPRSVKPDKSTISNSKIPQPFPTIWNYALRVAEEMEYLNTGVSINNFNYLIVGYETQPMIGESDIKKNIHELVYTKLSGKGEITLFDRLR